MTKESPRFRSEKPIPKERALDIISDSPDMLISQYADMTHLLIEEKLQILEEIPKDTLIREEIRKDKPGELIPFGIIE